jgi:hypothetical protein
MSSPGAGGPAEPDAASHYLPAGILPSAPASGSPNPRGTLACLLASRRTLPVPVAAWALPAAAWG